MWREKAVRSARRVRRINAGIAAWVRYVSSRLPISMRGEEWRRAPIHGQNCARFSPFCCNRRAEERRQRRNIIAGFSGQRSACS